MHLACNLGILVFKDITGPLVTITSTSFIWAPCHLWFFFSNKYRKYENSLNGYLNMMQTSNGRKVATGGVNPPRLISGRSSHKYFRYLNFPGRSTGAGWNNIVREQLLTAYLAYLSRRAFVVAPYITREHPPFAGATDLHILTAAFTWSPLTGAPFPGSRGYEPKDPSDEVVIPRLVSEDFYSSVCPRDRRVELDVGEVCKELGLDVDRDDVKVIAEAWARKLLKMEDSCIDIVNHPLFDFL